VNAAFFKNPRQGMLLTSIAGPGANFVLAVAFALAAHALVLLPLPTPLEETVGLPLVLICRAGVFVNLILCVFNLLPIPPLDGSNVLAFFLPERLANAYLSLGRFGFLILIGLILISRFSGLNLVGGVILPLVAAMARLLGVTL